MGADFNDMTLDGKLTKEEVRSVFADRCIQDGHDEGHSYSGSFSQFSGLRFTDQTFETMDEAHDWVQEHGEKWGPAVCVRHKLYKVPKLALNHDKARYKLEQKIWNSEAAARNARDKARLNNRSKTPAYVTKAMRNVEAVRVRIQPQMDARTAKIKAIIAKAAAKSKKSVWYLGGWCSS